VRPDTGAPGAVFIQLAGGDAAQLAAACAAVLLPGLATREALWVVVIGALGVLLAEDRRRPSSA
jgi:hypothetical protein